jgi:hypothetical protein
MKSCMGSEIYTSREQTIDRTKYLAQEESKEKGGRISNRNHIQNEKITTRRKGKYQQETWRSGEIEGNNKEKGPPIEEWRAKSCYRFTSDHNNSYFRPIHVEIIGPTHSTLPQNRTDRRPTRKMVLSRYE